MPTLFYQASPLVIADQLGNKLQAEVDIVMPRHTLLEESHDVGESLQRKVRVVCTGLILI